MNKKEILFRGRRIDNDELIEGFFYIVKDNYTKLDIYCIQSYKKIENNDFILTEVFYIDKDSLSQYIGIKDKNDIKIFENDLVKTKYGRVCKVVWNFNNLCYDLIPLECENKIPDEWDLWYSENLEIIKGENNE